MPNILMIVGAVIALYEWSYSHSLMYMPVWGGLAVTFIGWKMKGGAMLIKPSKPSVPGDFTVSFWNKNIALDANTGALWVREKSGKSIVLQRAEVLGWEMQNSNFSSQAVVGPRVTPMDNRMLIKTKNLEKPVWTVPFNAHTSLTGAGNHANHRELKEWWERLNVVYNHEPAKAVA